MSGEVLYPIETWEWYGKPGHFIAGPHCRFHMATVVGPWLVSTVGEYVPPRHVAGGDDVEFKWLKENWPGEDIGSGRKYETMVFRVDRGKRCEDESCGCGMPMVADWMEKDFSGYNNAGDATRGHILTCKIWSCVPDEEEATDEEEEAAEDDE